MRWCDNAAMQDWGLSCLSYWEANPGESEANDADGGAMDLGTIGLGQKQLLGTGFPLKEMVSKGYSEVG